MTKNDKKRNELDLIHHQNMTFNKCHSQHHRILRGSTKTIIVFVLGVIFGWLSATSITIHQFLHCSLTTTLASTDTASPRYLDGWRSIDVFVGNNDNNDIGILNDSTSHWVAQARQDEVVFLLLDNKTKGFFVDLAANDAIHLSNTYSLEKYHGWRGICIEPNPLYWFNLTRYRPQCQIVAAVVGTQRNQAVQFYYPGGDHGGIVGFDNNGTKFSRHARTEWTVTLQEVLHRHGVTNSIDYLSLDVEGAEEFILKDFPINQFKIKLLTVERPKEKLRTYLERHGYEQIQRLSRWGETLWVHKDMRSDLVLSRLDEFHGRKQYLAEKARRAKVPDAPLNVVN